MVEITINAAAINIQTEGMIRVSFYLQLDLTIVSIVKLITQLNRFETFYNNIQSRRLLFF